MAGSSATPIKAGKAYAEISLKDRMSAGLDTAKKKFESFSKGMATAAGYLTAAGSLVLGGLGAGIAAAMSIGSELTDVSDRTGVATDMLSALAAVAADTGATLSDVEAGLRGLSKFTFAVSKGGKQAAQVLDMLGISANDFLRADAIGRLGMIADGLARIQDPALRSALAMATLGKGGAMLIPMLSAGSKGLEDMIANAQRLGIVLDKDAIAKADEMERQFALLKQQGTAALFAIGAAVAEPMTQFIQAVQEGLATVIQFLKANKTAVQVVGVVGLSLVAVGSLMLAFAGTAQLAAFVMGGFTSAMAVASAAVAAFGTVVAIVKAILAPELLVIYGIVGLVTLALVAGVWAWMAWTESGQAAASRVGQAFQWLGAIVGQTMSGIFDAIMAGDWSLAFEIGVQAMNVVWMRSMAGLTVLWESFVGFFADAWVGVVSTFKLTVSSMLPNVVNVLVGIHDYIVSWANSIASLLGFEIRFDGIDLLKDYQAQVNIDAKTRRDAIDNETKAQLAANQKVRDDRIAQARFAVRAAQDDLTDMTGKAKRSREDMAAKLRPKVTAPKGDAFSGAAIEAQPGGVMGTFSASVAGLLGRSTPDINDASKKTAENTGEMKDLLEELLGKASDGLVFE